jgi:hypothetical protein
MEKCMRNRVAVRKENIKIKLNKENTTKPTANIKNKNTTPISPWFYRIGCHHAY